MLLDPSSLFRLPLSIIALIDMNAFFAQCEQHRLGKTLQDPVVCCQWSSLIAVSYAARKFGIGRMDTLNSAREKCPHLIVGHAAVFKKGESHWLYLEGPADRAEHKVSLDPYRRELRKIVKILKRRCDLVERASVDECYMDFGRLVHARLVELFPELKDLGAEEDPLPTIPDKFPPQLRWQGEIFPTEGEENDGKQELLQTGKELENTQLVTSVPDNLRRLPSISDWDDVCMLIGSQILYQMRVDIYDELNYTTSGGLATTKTVAKLAGGFIKPDLQTIIRPKAINAFLTNFELTDTTSMGGKLGEVILQKLDVPPNENSNSYIRENFTFDQIKEHFPTDLVLAERVFEFVRGLHHQELIFRTDVKSMMLRKNLLEKKPVKTLADAYDWIKVFVGDLYGRLIEVDDENMNLLMLQKSQGDKEFIYRPRTVSLQLTTASWSKFSKQGPFSVIKDLERLRILLELACFRLLCGVLENTNTVDLNSGIKLRDLHPTDPDLDKIKIPTLTNMAVVISNFVKTSDANLIDSYGAPSKAAENLKRAFEEVNSSNQVLEAQAEQPKISRSNSYIKKLFQDFENEKQTNSKPIDLEKPKGTFKEDRNYVNQLFERYKSSLLVDQGDQSNSTDEKSGSKTEEAPLDEKKGKGSSAIKSSSKEPTPVPEDALLKELILKRFCSSCNVAVDDVFEHKDFHIALDLSLKLNGQSHFKRTPNSSPKKASSSPKKASTSPKKKVKKPKVDKGQSTLPF